MSDRGRTARRHPRIRRRRDQAWRRVLAGLLALWLPWQMAVGLAMAVCPAQVSAEHGHDDAHVVAGHGACDVPATVDGGTAANPSSSPAAHPCGACVTGIAPVAGVAHIVTLPSIDGRVHPADPPAHVEFLSEGNERPPKPFA